MKVYLSVPMISNRALPRAHLLAKAIRESGHEVSSPWVLGPIESPTPSATNVFRRDMEGAENSDILVADVTEPSTGVGMEIMAADKAGRRIIRVEKRGCVTSRMLSHMDPKEAIEYDLDEEAYLGLKRALLGGR